MRLVTSCFFCQNLLSDFVEGILPAARHEELKKHLNGCSACNEVHHDLVSALEILHQMPSRPLGNEMSLRITEASHSGQARWMTRVGISQIVLFASVPLLLFAGGVLAFPKLFPWFTDWRSSPDESQFVRYFPVLQGATDILEEQGSWLYARDSSMASLWEEGGLSPEDFERSFQVKPSQKSEMPE